MSSKITGIAVRNRNGYSDVHPTGAGWEIEDSLSVLDKDGKAVATYSYGNWSSVQYVFGDEE